MIQVLCDHCKRAFEPPESHEYEFTATGKDGRKYELNVLSFFENEDTDCNLCVDCLVYLMGAV